MSIPTLAQELLTETVSPLLGDCGLTLPEFIMRDPLPLAVVQDAVFDFLRGRDVVVVFGAQSVTAWTFYGGCRRRAHFRIGSGRRDACLRGGAFPYRGTST